MSTIRQVLVLHRQGQSNRSIAKDLGIDKETVNNYVKTFKSDELGIEGLLGLENPELEYRLRRGNSAVPDPRFDDFINRIPYLLEEIGKPHVTVQRLWEEYIEEYPQGYKKLF